MCHLCPSGCDPHAHPSGGVTAPAHPDQVHHQDHGLSCRNRTRCRSRALMCTAAMWLSCCHAPNRKPSCPPQPAAPTANMLHGHRQRLQQQEVEQRPALRASHPSPTHRKLKDSASERNVGGRSQSQGAPNRKNKCLHSKTSLVLQSG